MFKLSFVIFYILSISLSNLLTLDRKLTPLFQWYYVIFNRKRTFNTFTKEKFYIKGGHPFYYSHRALQFFKMALIIRDKGGEDNYLIEWD